ncbi:MarR family winged helix-turn-helix transcriptional regulator [Pseudoalteromonas sp. S16_S37]|uniref:MarR family winged helix-turn-helix transcriptional regulator n=1 Tax=Pseudoalteromonas sp. S16_S37 TaxID=2720228 RepID=UPI001680FC2E|nr:MarR family transcriptional regulator [Pseudoalteromonas sp. S16_S37]MBD1582628.1 MarR family transcriptional regulator [Pseudoalteromonas sp. S16_S37]
MSNKARQSAFELSKNIEQPYDLYNHVPYRIAVASNLLAMDRDAYIKNLTGLETREIRVLLNIGSYGPINAADIAYQSRLDPYSVNRAINTLMKLELICADNDHSKQRSKFVKISEQGLPLYEQVVAHMREREKNVLKDISEDEKQLLLSLLEKIELRAEAALAQSAQLLESQGHTITRDQKELIRWHKRSAK